MSVQELLILVSLNFLSCLSAVFLTAAVTDGAAAEVSERAEALVVAGVGAARARGRGVTARRRVRVRRRRRARAEVPARRRRLRKVMSVGEVWKVSRGGNIVSAASV